MAYDDLFTHILMECVAVSEVIVWFPPLLVK